MEMALLPANWEINQPRLMLMMLVAGFDMVAAVIFLIFFGIGGSMAQLLTSFLWK